MDVKLGSAQAKLSRAKKKRPGPPPKGSLTPHPCGQAGSHQKRLMEPGTTLAKGAIAEDCRNGLRLENAIDVEGAGVEVPQKKDWMP